jgi:hypothetical protein
MSRRLEALADAAEQKCGRCYDEPATPSALWEWKHGRWLNSTGCAAHTTRRIVEREFPGKGGDPVKEWRR